MSYNAANIRDAIIELLDGTTSSIRAVTSATFAFGVFAGQPVAAQEALVTDTATGTHRFDVEFGPLTDHISTPSPSAATSRLARLQVSIPVWTKVATTVEESERRSRLAAIRDDCETAMQALGFPGNLRQTAAAGATNLAGGMMSGLAWRIESEQWDRNLIISRIECECLVTIGLGDPIQIFGSLLELWWDFNDASTITTAGGSGTSLTSITDKSGNGHTGTPVGTFTWFASGGPNGRGYVTNVTDASNTYVGCTGLPITSASRISRMAVSRIRVLDPPEGGVALILGMRSVGPPQVYSTLSYSHDSFGPPSLVWYTQAGLGYDTAAVTPPAVQVGTWNDGQHHMLAGGSLVRHRHQQEVGGDYPLHATYDSTTAIRACERRTDCSTAIMLVGEPSLDQIARYTAWAHAVHAL